MTVQKNNLDYSMTFGERAAARRQDKEERQKAEFWINIGVVLYDGDGNEGLVTLPFGLPLDTMIEAVIPRSGNEDFAITQRQRNELRAQLLDYGKTFAPGEARIVPNLVAELRRVNTERTLPTGEGYSLPKLFEAPAPKSEAA